MKEMGPDDDSPALAPGEFLIDASGFPLVSIVYPADSPVEGIDRYLERIGRVFERGRFVTVVDIRAVSLAVAHAANRKRVAEGIDRLTEAFPGVLVGEAVVVANGLMRGMVTAYNWLRRDKSTPTEVFTGLDDARGWARERARLAGLL
ncbi:MAG: hypothetical protein RLP09_14735 [Sandaracinaceae bacterium]